MKNVSYQRIYQSREYLSPLGHIHHRALFGGYSLAIEDTVFAMVAEGALYLRACEESAPYYTNAKAPLLTFVKRGRPVLLNYFRVDDGLWQDRETLLTLCQYSLAAAQREKIARRAQKRLRDLPNLNFQLETLLWEAGVKDEPGLKQLGAKACWLRLKERSPQLSIKVLFALEGAITGLHEAALPAETRRELTVWFKELEAESSLHQRGT
ncbi:TfoX/Sxy family DNA transformation protein [Pseudescherichia vulneris]|uniref:TfoX/Sxy family DNA transformation protein n=1 Tax=Pseudescherichia vulneris TaxID=566 RepID=UPI00227C1B24|nr:TfoX/Sxy family DNA transformation protein [Pseudescherichia vulneris]WAH53387.1 TfoX/Sxy family DNA transformation protein [Pseudescherichia vulneris]